MPLTADSELRELLENAKTIAVVGYSDRPDRPSHSIAHMLINVGYNVYFVNPTLTPDPENRLYTALRDIPEKIDIVDIFRRAEFIPETVNNAIEVGAKAVWIQLGIVNHEAAQTAESAGMTVVMDRCIKVDYYRLCRS